MGRIISIWLFFNLSITCFALHAQENQVDSLNELLSTNHTYNKIKILNQIGDYYVVDSPALAFNYYSKTYDIARQLKNDTLLADSYKNMGFSKLKTNDYLEAKKYLIQALDMYKKSVNENKLAFTYKQLGLAEYYIGNYEQSMRYYQIALKKFIFLENQQEQANIYQNMGMVHHDLENVDEALNYYNKSLQINEKLNNKFHIAGLTQNIGLLFLKKNDLDTALIFMKKSLRIFKKIEDKKHIGVSISNIGLIYQNQEKYSLALEYYQKSLEVFTKIDYHLGKLWALHNIGSSYSDLGDSDKALLYYQQSLKLSRVKDHVQGILANYEAISSLYSNLNDYEKSLYYYKLYDELEDSVSSAEAKEKIAEMDVVYKMELLDNELSKKDIELLHLKRQKFIFFIGSLVLLILLFVSIIAYVQKRKIEKELNKHKKNLEDLIEQRTAELNIEITERKIAEESDKLKSAFLANMSHELRTPMNAIIAFTNFIKDPDLSNEEREEYINYITTAGESLLQLIDDIIDSAKIEAQLLKINKTECNITQLFIELFTIFSELKKKRNKENIKLILNPSSIKNNLIIKTDPLRLKQILTNLLDNALKYTLEGSVEFGFERLDEYIRFYVKDTGIGIPKKKFKSIFNRFYQIDQSVKKQFAGTGLGLAITKNLVNLLGGEIWLESKVSSGSIFYFTIPSDHINIKPHLNKKNIELYEKKAFDSYDWNGKKILIAEDEDLNYKILESVLKKTNAKVIRASNGIEALKFIQEYHIDLVLMDIQMPKMDGYKATQEIKKINNQLPVIAQTSFAMEGEREKCLGAGCDDYMAKPLNLHELLAKIDYYL